MPQRDHKAAVALFFGVYHFVRRHEALKTTPAVAVGVGHERWNLGDFVEMKDAYLRRKAGAEIRAGI